jgi:hypothetical protein
MSMAQHRSQILKLRSSDRDATSSFEVKINKSHHQKDYDEMRKRNAAQDSILKNSDR